MGLSAGSVSFVRYLVDGQLPQPFWETVAQRVAAFSFKDIDETLDEYSIGWVSVGGMFDTDFRYASYAAGDYVVLSLRVDERRVAPAVLKKFVLKEEEQVRREKQIPRLARSVRVEIKERVRNRLVRAAAPVPALFDLCWSLADGTLTFFSTNRRAMGMLEELFRECFGLNLVLQIPYLDAARLLPPELQDRLDSLSPAVLA